jgi:hypothetical protein
MEASSMVDFTEEQQETIVALYLDGNKARKIAKGLRCETDDVVQVLNDRSIPLRHRRSPALPSVEEIEERKAKIRADKETARLGNCSHRAYYTIPSCSTAKRHNGQPMVNLHD